MTSVRLEPGAALDPKDFGVASGAGARDPLPRISGLPPLQQAWHVLQWQLKRRGLPSHGTIPLAVDDFWRRNLATKSFTVEVRYVDERTGHGVFMKANGGANITKEMAHEVISLLLDEARMPAATCPDPECCRLYWYWHRYFAIHIGNHRNSPRICHGLAATVFRSLNGPDPSADRTKKYTWPWVVFNEDGKLVHLPRGHDLEVRLDYAYDGTTQSPENFDFRTHDPEQELSMIPFCTTEAVFSEATIRHILLGPGEPTAAAAAAVAGKRSSREPREWGGLLGLLEGKFDSKSWFDASVPRENDAAGDDARKKWWDFHIKPGRVSDIIGPEAEAVLKAAYELLKSRLPVKRKVWNGVHTTTHHLLVSYAGAPAQAPHQDGCQATILIPLQQPPHSGGTIFTSKSDPASTFCFNDILQPGCAVCFDGAVQHFGAANKSDQIRLLYFIEVGDRNS